VGDVVLRAVELAGMFAALAAPLMVLALVRPALHRLRGDTEAHAAGSALATSAARWGARTALLSGVAVLVQLLGRVADIEGTSVLAGVDPGMVARFALITVTGRLALAEGLALLAAAATMASARRNPLAASSAWWATAGLAGAAVIARSLAGHAAAQPTGRALAIAAQLTHLVAAAGWLGVVGQLLAARVTLRRATAPGAQQLVAAVVARFSPLAAAAAGLLTASGLFAAWWYLAAPGAALASAYGLTLLTKLALAGPLLAAALVNARLVRPALARARDPRPVLARLCRALEVEVGAGVLVIAVAGVLAAVAPPGADGTLRLTGADARALLTPRLPATSIDDPATWIGAPTRTLGDLRYAEFTHAWSGVVVCLLGLAWLLQQQGGRVGRHAGWLWPLILLPFAAFVVVASDPEFWPLGPVPISAGLANPSVIGHRLAAGLVVLLAGLGWRAMARQAPNQPLGSALPVVLIVGSLLFLGHVHQGSADAARLETLIGVQHTVLGALGLLAGVVRWLELREFLPRRVAGLLWPGLIVALGAIMAFWYREVV
jgi:putative copper resistance protein D